MNELKSILVHLDSSPKVEKRLRFARRFAEDLDAELTGLYAVPSIGNALAFAVASDDE